MTDELPMDAAWRDFVKTFPDFDNPMHRAAFMAGASSAFAIGYYRGFDVLRRELLRIGAELIDGERADG